MNHALAVSCVCAHFLQTSQDSFNEKLQSSAEGGVLSVFQDRTAAIAGFDDRRIKGRVQEAESSCARQSSGAALAEDRNESLAVRTVKADMFSTNRRSRG